MKDIKNLLKKIEIEEKTIENIGKFLKTKRGQQFVSNLHTAPLRDLCLRYHTPKFLRLYTNDVKNKNLIIAAIKKYDITIPITTPVEIRPPIKVKCKIRLTKKELTEIDARRPRKMGFAALMHAYEEHKVQRFITKHPTPTERELKQDLFPEEITTTRGTQLWLYREYTRNFLCKVYANVEKRERYYRLFCIYDNKIAKGKIYEKEGDPMVVGYPFTRYDEKTPIDTLKQILRDRAKIVAKKDPDVKELRLFTKYGTLIASVKV